METNAVGDRRSTLDANCSQNNREGARKEQPVPNSRAVESQATAQAAAPKTPLGQPDCK